ncbi:MAG: ATP synthase F1 subunit gamma [Lachnospiraceae bacterium]|nr:ATP synthase F1 subunit gamma [Lachnospiraceae bacterium]
MSNAKELQNRIKSVQDTMKITNAMYMMSSMKLRKARNKLDNTKPFFESLQMGITDVLLHYPDMEHMYFDNANEDRDKIKKKAYIIVTGDKGMAGAYNHNVIKEALSRINKDDKLLIVGELGRHAFSAMGYEVDPEFLFSANNPSIHRARVISETIIEMFDNDVIDEVNIIFTYMVNSMKSELRVEQLLPLKTHTFMKDSLLQKAMTERESEKTLEQIAREAEDWYQIYPTPRKLLTKIVRNYITGYIYGVLVEASASEENARMMAMQSATDNARDMLSSLKIEFNRVRQAAITQEITEVIGGAKALKKAGK